MLNKGDIVKVIQAGAQYNHFFSMAEYMELKNFHNGRMVLSEDICEVVTGIYNHFSMPCIYLIGIRSLRTGYDHIIEIDAVSLIRRKSSVSINIDTSLFDLE